MVESHVPATIGVPSKVGQSAVPCFCCQTSRLYIYIYLSSHPGRNLTDLHYQVSFESASLLPPDRLITLVLADPATDYSPRLLH